MALGLRIFFQDESIVLMNPTIKKGWFLKGSKPVQLVSGSRKKTCMFGAVSEGKKVLMYADKTDIKSFKKFLKKLSKLGKCLLVLDNSSWHKSKKVRKYAETLGIVLWFLPPYSPELNPIEQLWRMVKNSVTYRMHCDMDDLKCAVRRFVNKCDFYVDVFKYYG